MNLPKIKDAFCERSIQVEQVIHMGTMCCEGDRWPSDVQDAFMEEGDEIWEAIGIEPPDHDDDIGLLTDEFEDRDIHGFLIKAATPVPRNIREDGFGISWSSYTTTWIYGLTYIDCCKKAIKWRDAYIEKKTGISQPSIEVAE